VRKVMLAAGVHAPSEGSLAAPDPKPGY
jgi:hypothetical protein